MPRSHRPKLRTYNNAGNTGATGNGFCLVTNG